MLSLVADVPFWNAFDLLLFESVAISRKGSRFVHGQVRTNQVLGLNKRRGQVINLAVLKLSFEKIQLLCGCHKLPARENIENTEYFLSGPAFVPEISAKQPKHTALML